MKNSILGATALVAVTVLTIGSVSAAEKIKLNVGGYLQTTFIAASYDNGGFLPTNLRNEGEVHFTGSTTLDNGLKFGVNIQLEAREATDQVDETFMYVEGAFGRINVGSENAASYLMHYSAPSPAIGYSLNKGKFNPSGFEGPKTYPDVTSDADKITYFTPRIAGLQFGASYTPDGDWETGQQSPYSPVGTDGTADESYSAGINYVNTFNNVSVAASLGYDILESTTAEDEQNIAVGGRVDFAGFKVGASYRYTDNEDGILGQDRQDATIGVTYSQGPWTAGIQYARIELDNSSDGELNAVVIGGKYTISSGIRVTGGVQFFKTDGDLEDNAAGGVGDSATIFFVGTALSF